MDQSESTAANLVRRSRKTTRRRWLQFSIRTLLVLVTLLCVAFSLWVVPLERRRQAAAAVEALGGRVSFVDSKTNESFPTTLLRRWLPQGYVDEVAYVDLGSTRVTDAGLAHLKGLTSLEGLWLQDIQVTDAGLAYVQGLTGLKYLFLDSTHVTDAGLKHLQGLPHLETLRLEDTQVTDAGLAHLQGLKSLQQLSLCNTQVTDAGLAHLKGLTGLRELYLDNTQVTDAGLAHLKGLTSLRTIRLDNTQVGYAGQAELRKALPNCHIYGP